MTSVTTMSRMRRVALILGAVALMLVVRMFSAAPAMADPMVTPEPPQPVIEQQPLEQILPTPLFPDGLFDSGTVFDNGTDIHFDKGSDHAIDKAVDHDVKADRR